MSNRLDQERQERLEPKRVAYAEKKLEEKGVNIVRVGEKRIDFIYKGARCMIYPYSGWHTGKTIKDGRGVQNLLNQL